jgi:hypothetical protein
VKRQDTIQAMGAEQAVALAQAINETASAGSLENSKTPGSRGPRGVRTRNASQLGGEPGAKS